MNSKGRILLVDDKKHEIEPLQHQLQDKSYKVLTATSGKQALDIMHSNKIDILVSDICMPDMNGIELIRQTGKHYPGIRSIVITGFADVDSAAEAMRLGAVNYLQKPKEVDADMLDSALKKAMKDKKTAEDRVHKELDQAEANHRKTKRREACAALMGICVRYWKSVVMKDETELAEECIVGNKKIWKLHKDVNGVRPRRLIAYCDINKLPKNPKIGDVLDTAYFVFLYTPAKPDDEMKKELKKKIGELETLLVQKSVL
ncbi:MAG: response regulator [Desulfobacteraceae bacterium]|nr:response regulator [Desulfobacteraceae bacterium]